MLPRAYFELKPKLKNEIVGSPNGCLHAQIVGFAHTHGLRQDETLELLCL